ncbi:xylose isomerase-like isoform X2 [Quercus robur]|uniref:xylose isomerase-like isoform X2 n=1 Tax=Quercus robur TaxID=38942 RepID=UPI0021635212|nr:xylose isomerase-like isoform X2 [Quercus robur]
MLKQWYKFSGYGQEKNETNFGFINKLGFDWWCFHDRDIAPDGKTLEESNANLDEVVALAKKLQKVVLPLMECDGKCLRPCEVGREGGMMNKD